MLSLFTLRLLLTEKSYCLLLCVIKKVNCVECSFLVSFPYNLAPVNQIIRDSRHRNKSNVGRENEQKSTSDSSEHFCLVQRSPNWIFYGNSTISPNVKIKS